MKITNAPAFLNMKTGETRTLKTDRPAILWRTSGALIASIDEGILSAHKAGTVTIEATDASGEKAMITVKISN